MAKDQGLTFKELVEAQKRLAAKGDATAQKQLEKLKDLAKSVEVQTDQSTKQNQILQNVEKNQKIDKVIQVGQALEQKELIKEAEKSTRDEDDLVKSAKELNKMLKKTLVDKSGEGMNSNVIKMFKEIQKISKLTAGQKKDILEKNREKREFKTIGTRIQNVKENVKDFFTLRGFLDKTGIVKRGSGGIFSEPLDAREDRKKYAKERIAAGDPTVNLYGKRGAQRIFERQRKEVQQLTRDQGRAERKIQQYRDLGISEKQIEKSPEAMKLSATAERLAAIDPALRPEGYKPQGKRPLLNPSEMKVTRDEENRKGITSEEAQSEAQRVQQEQLDILKKIEENTRPFKAKKQEAAPEKSESSPIAPAVPFGRSLMAGFRKMAKSAGSGLVRVAKTVKSFALPALAAVAGGAAIDYGAGKLGVGKDAQGKDIAINEKQDDANWNKMSIGQKAISGIGRTIEKAGSLFFLGNMSRQARAERIENETKMLQQRQSNAAAAAPKTSEMIYTKSAAVSPSAAGKGEGGDKTLVNAPTTINKKVENTFRRSAIRNNDRSYVDYLNRRYAG